MAQSSNGFTIPWRGILKWAPVVLLAFVLYLHFVTTVIAVGTSILLYRRWGHKIPVLNKPTSGDRWG